jgi:adenine-specific DNA-methyltransferase
MVLHLNYIGSKKTLFTTLDKVFQKYVTSSTVFGDFFAGTGTVAYMVQQKYKCQVITNDLQYYAYVLNRAILAKISKEEQKTITSKIDEYNALPGIKGFMARKYAPPKRKYFTLSNASRIDAMRMKLEHDRPSLNENVYYYLLASIIVAADRVANTSSVYASYLKEFKTSALKPITLAPYVKNRVRQKSRWYNDDVLNIIDDIKCDVLYLDPPYNTRQYGTYYHILETIAKYDNPKIHGITGVREDSLSSAFSSKVQVEEAFQNLVAKVKAKVLIMSYNDEGIVPHDRMMAILKQHGRVRLYKIPYKKFIAQDGVDRKTLYEYLFVSVK